MKKRLLGWIASPLTGLTFGAVCLVYQTVYTMVPVRLAIQGSVLAYLSPALAVAGIALLAVTLLAQPRRYWNREMAPCWGILLALALSTLTNPGSGLTDNVKTFLWQADILLPVLGCSRELGEHPSAPARKALTAAVAVLLLVADAAAAQSLVMGFRMAYAYVAGRGEVFHQGVHEGRLFGVYITPYVGSRQTALAMVAAVWLLRRAKGWGKAFAAVSLALCGAVCVLTGARAVLLGLMAAAFTVTALWWGSGHRGGMQRFAAVLLALTAAVGVFAIYTLSDLGLRQVILAVQNDAPQTAAERMPAARPSTQGNVSSNRFAIWRDYVRILADRPEKLPFGYSPGGCMAYIDREYPDFFIVQYFKEHYPVDYAAHGQVYGAHNAALTVAVSTGLAGLAAAAWCAARLLGRVAALYRQGRLRWEDYAALAAVAIMATAMLFESDVFYVCNPGALVFWPLVGYLWGRGKETEERG